MKKIVLSLACLGLMFAGTALAEVNINTASSSELVSLDGIGNVKAQAIVKDRKANGQYQQLSDLTRVSGVGDKTVEGISEQAGVGESSGEMAD